MSETISTWNGEGLESGRDQTPAMGTMAGRIWTILRYHGKQSVSALVKRIGAPRDYVMEGIGWLAREGKIRVVEESRVRVVSLVDENGD